MTNHVVLSSVEHRNLRINTERSTELGDDVMTCITVPNEFRNIQSHYPILFQLSQERDEFHSIALFGFEKGENLFLKDGVWDAGYKPLAIDIQPFLIGLPREKDGDRQIHIDLDSPRVNTDDGIRVFDDHGVLTDFLESISAKLAALHDGYLRSADFIKCLQKFELLEPFVLEVALRDGSKNRLVGFHTINEEKLKSLEGAALYEMNQKGYLLPLFMVVASLSNIVSLVERKNALVEND